MKPEFRFYRQPEADFFICEVKIDGFELVTKKWWRSTWKFTASWLLIKFAWKILTHKMQNGKVSGENAKSGEINGKKFN
jgi:hypothetical protein